MKLLLIIQVLHNLGDRWGGVIVCVRDSRAEGRRFDPQLGQSKAIKIKILR